MWVSKKCIYNPPCFKHNFYDVAFIRGELVMSKLRIYLLFLIFLSITGVLKAQQGLIPIPEFEIKEHEITLRRLARPGTPFVKAGRRFAFLGDESGSFEAWAYPLKLIRNFKFSFFIGNSTRPIHARDIVHSIEVSPLTVTFTYSYQSFTVKAVYMVPVEEPGAIILLKIDTTEPLSIVCGFLPVLQPMWPAGIGGQYAFWDDQLKAYVISESSRKNHAFIGSPAASGLSYTPAHMLSDEPNEFRINIPEPNKVKHQYIPIYMAGGKGERGDIVEIYKKLQNNPYKYYQNILDHFRRLRNETLQIQTPDPKLNLAFAWTKIVYDSLMVDHPELGKGLIAGLGASGSSGRPGFGWFFGGDAFINTLSISGYGAHKDVRDILAFTQKWQRRDGKMAHELSQAEGYIDWWNDYPYGYIHGDTTPYYLAAMYNYVKISGDEDFIRQSWDSIRNAYEWCLTTDVDDDGLMDNKKAGLGALEYGALTGIQTDIYLAAVWVRAAYAMQKLAAMAGQKKYMDRAKTQYQKAKKSFQTKFWDETSQFYAYAFSEGGQLVKEISPWCGLGLMWDLGTPQESLAALARLCRSDLFTDWGMRSISRKSQYFQPQNYNYGAVWPFITSWVTAALFKHHLPQQGYALLMATAGHTFDHALGGIPEVFSGVQHARPQESVVYQGFSSAGVTLPVVRGLCGLDGSALDKVITFAPHFPADWEQVAVHNYAVGKARFSFDYHRQKDSLKIKINSRNAAGYTIHLAPALGSGSRIQSLKIDGVPQEFKVREFPQVIQPYFEIPADQNHQEVVLDYIPYVEVLPSIPLHQVGAGNQSLKIISIQNLADGLIIQVEGLVGKIYSVSVINHELINRIEGARLDGQRLFFQIPGDKTGEWIVHTIKLIIKRQE